MVKLNLKVKLENLINKEINFTNLSDWKRTGAIFTEDNISFAFIYSQSNMAQICHVSLSEERVFIIGSNSYYLDIKSHKIKMFEEQKFDLDFTSKNTQSILYYKYKLFLEQIKC